MEPYDNLSPDDPNSSFSYIINGPALWDAVFRNVTKENANILLNSPAYRAVFATPEEQKETNFFFSSTLCADAESDGEEKKESKRIVVARSGKDVIDVKISSTQTLKDRPSISENNDQNWIDLISSSFEGVVPPSNELIETKLKALRSLDPALFNDPLFCSFLNKKPNLNILNHIAKLNDLDGEPSVIKIESLGLNSEEINELLTCAITYETIKKGIEKHRNCSWGFAFHACQSLPKEYQNQVWTLLVAHLPNENTGELESILSTLLISKHYSFKEIISILQIIGIIALATPSVQGDHKYSFVQSNSVFPLHLTTQKGDTFRFPLNMNAPEEFKSLTGNWAEHKPLQFQLKKLFQTLLPNLHSGVAICPQFKTLYSSSPLVKKWLMSSFDMMTSPNGFVCTLGYRLFFAESALNSRCLMRLDTYLINLPKALNFITVKDSEKKREFYLLFSRYVGVEKFSVHLKALANRIDWSKSNLTEIIFGYIELLTEDESKEGFLRNPGWTLWLKQQVKAETSAQWQSILKTLLRLSDMSGKDKGYLLQVCDLAKTRIDEGKLLCLESREIYRALTPYAKELAVQVRLAQDVLHLFSTAPREFINSNQTINLFVDLMTPLMQTDQLPLLHEMIDLLLPNTHNVARDNLARIILDVCYLTERNGNTQRAYSYWKRISQKFRKVDPAPDLKLVISFARFMYHSIITKNTPQSEFQGLIEIIEKSKTNEITPAELRKYKLVISTEITNENLEEAAQIAKDSSKDNRDFAFFMKCRVFELRLKNQPDTNTLGGILPEFNALINEAKTAHEYQKVEEIFHQYLLQACEKSTYNPIVIDRLINHSECMLHFGTTYYKAVAVLITVLKRQGQKKIESHLISHINHTLQVALNNKSDDAVLTIVDAFLVVHQRTKSVEHKILKDSALWISQQLAGHKRVIQREFLEFLIIVLPGELKTQLLPVWLSILKEYAKKDYGPVLLNLLDQLKKQNILSVNHKKEKVELIETLIDQWSTHLLIPCDVHGWITHFCELRPSPEYLTKSREKILNWISILTAARYHQSAVSLLNLLGYEDPAMWNQILDTLYGDEKFDAWLNILVEAKNLFKRTSDINDYSRRLPLVYTSTPKNIKSVEKFLDLLAVHPLDSAPTWRHLLIQVNALNSPQLKAKAIAIVTAPEFKESLFSDNEEHGVRSWLLILNFMLEFHQSNMEWLTARNFLKKPFLTKSPETTQFLTTLLTFYLSSPKAESPEGKYARLTTACEISSRIMQGRTLVPGNHRPQIVKLMEQLAKSGSRELLVKGCGIASSILSDKETVKAASTSIHHLYTCAEEMDTLEDVAEKDSVNTELEALTEKMIGANCKGVDFFHICFSLFKRNLENSSFDAFRCGLNIQAEFGLGEKHHKDAQLSAYLTYLIEDKKVFQDEGQRITHCIDLIDCVVHPLVKSRIKRSILKKWGETLLTQLINIMMPDRTKKHSEELLKERFPIAEMIFERYGLLLKNTSHDDEINQELQQSILIYLSRYKDSHHADCVRFILQYDGIMYSRLIDKKCTSYNKSPEKHSERHYDFLYELMLTLCDTKAYRHMFYEMIHRFTTCLVASHSIRSKMLYYYLFSFFPRDEEGYKERLRNCASLLTEGINNKIWNTPFNGEFCSLTFLCGQDEDRILSDKRFSPAGLEVHIKLTITNLFKSSSPYAIQRGLDILNKHISLISFNELTNSIFKDFTQAVRNASLTTTFVNRHLTAIQEVIRYSIAVEAKKLNNSIEWRDNADDLICDLINLRLEIIKRTQNSTPEVLAGLSQWMNETIKLCSTIADNVLFMNRMSLMLDTILELKEQKKLLSPIDNLGVLVHQLIRIEQFTDIPSLELAREFLKIFTKNLVMHSISETTIATYVARITLTLIKAPFNNEDPRSTLPVQIESNDDVSTEEYCESNEGEDYCESNEEDEPI